MLGTNQNKLENISCVISTLTKKNILRRYSEEQVFGRFSVCMIVSAFCVQAIYTTYSNEATLKLPYSITITGIVCSIFAFGIPHLSALRLWLGVSTVMSLIYIAVAIGLYKRWYLLLLLPSLSICLFRTVVFFSQYIPTRTIFFLYILSVLMNSYLF